MKVQLLIAISQLGVTRQKRSDNKKLHGNKIEERQMQWNLFFIFLNTVIILKTFGI